MCIVVVGPCLCSLFVSVCWYGCSLLMCVVCRVLVVVCLWFVDCYVLFVVCCLLLLVVLLGVFNGCRFVWRLMRVVVYYCRLVLLFCCCR